ncbi:Chitinase [Labilithrix luteola]|uniref:Chitinase n=1 Tax=Labilithrix luteola TaxID=1391654 RepID=A0A0K1Q4R5_9BACT|nr:M36 family metallopeptidase [Labilithrix luteola]AKV00662.1 Chitinase [Labilithrix luteola]
MMSRSLKGLSLGLLFFWAALGCSSSDKKTSPPVTPATSAPSFDTFVAHRDARLAAPNFVWIGRSNLPKFTSAREAAQTSIRSVASAFRLDVRDARALDSLADVEIHDVAAGPIVARVKQRLGGVEVFRGGLNVLMSRAFEPIAATGIVASSFEGADHAFVFEHGVALEKAWAEMSSQNAAFSHLDAAGEYERFRGPGLAQPARVKKVLFPSKQDGKVVTQPAYYVEIMLTSGPARSFVVSAVDGEVLFDNDLVRHDAFSYRVYASATTLLPADGPQGNTAAPHPTGRPDGFKPTWGPSTLVTLANYPFSKNDPWLGAGATTTEGNNVVAYADLAAPDGFTSGTDRMPTTTSPNTFDRAYDTTQQPLASVDAASTHLFYVTNFLHDWYYDSGFDEQSGNHQLHNFGRGGKENDPLLAEAQDYSGRNNANATTPADGASPRLQMFVFSGSSAASLEVAAPESVAGTKNVGIAGFGKDSFEISGSVILADDGQGTDVRDGCEPLTNDVAGKIVLVHRGLCSFVQKVTNVQGAGGIGVLVANVASSASPDQPPYMGGTSSAVTIPVLSLALADGTALEAATASGLTVTLKRALQTDLDGALDTTVVAHEWGHVLSNRLIGDGSGLTTNQAGGLGEGWGDFSGLLVMAREDDVESPAGANWAGAYPNGAYATSGGGADFYFGIRRVPYSVDFTKDPLTFKHIQNGVALPAGVPISFGEDGSFNAEVHSTGEVWATMLWECYVALLRKHGFAEGQARMKRYFLASLKLTPVDPTLLAARDAVLAAALAADPGDFQLFWEAFARRGAGVGAEGPPADSADNVGVVESTFVGNDVEIDEATIADDVVSCDHDGILDEGETGSITLKLRNAGVGTLEAPVAKITSKQVELVFPDGDETKLPALKPFEVTTVKAKVRMRKGEPTKAIELDVAVTDPTIPAERTVHKTIPTRYQTDEVAEGSAVDNVDTRQTAWKASASKGNSFATPWTRSFDGVNGWWSVVDVPEKGNQTLTSPPFTIDGTTFGLAFKHRWSFRFSTRRNVDIDGGVVEISVDGGTTWKDASEYGTVDYNTTLDNSDRSDNPYKGRRAYGNKSAGYPAKWVNSRMDVTLPEHPETVRIRFRTGTGTGFAGAQGWDVDDIELSGISSTPFWAFVPHQDLCDENGPVASAGAPQSVAPKTHVTLNGSGSSPSGAPLAFEWMQVTGPSVSLTGGDTATAAFDAPDTTDPVVLTFQLRANDGALLSPASGTEVTVAIGAASGDSGDDGGCSSSPAKSTKNGFGAALLALVGLVLRKRRSR